MITCFNFHGLDNERLLADAPNQEHRILRCSAGHLDVNRRVSDLAVEVKHNNRAKRLFGLGSRDVWSMSGYWRSSGGAS
jgi:hypothetical protein